MAAVTFRVAWCAGHGGSDKRQGKAPHRGGLMHCPVCELELGVERLGGELVLTYSFKEWTAGCRCPARGDPALCGHLLPTILEQLQGCKVTPFDRHLSREGSI